MCLFYLLNLETTFQISQINIPRDKTYILSRALDKKKFLINTAKLYESDNKPTILSSL